MDHGDLLLQRLDPARELFGIEVRAFRAELGFASVKGAVADEDERLVPTEVAAL